MGDVDVRLAAMMIDGLELQGRCCVVVRETAERDVDRAARSTPAPTGSCVRR